MATAKETYKTNEAIIKQQIKMLQEALKKHSKLFKKNETHWGYVGDLGSVKSTLSELDGFLKSATVEIIENSIKTKRVRGKGRYK